MSKTFRVEIVIPYVVDEVDSKEEAETYGQYLVEQIIGNHRQYFEVRAFEVEDAETS